MTPAERLRADKQAATEAQQREELNRARQLKANDKAAMAKKRRRKKNLIFMLAVLILIAVAALMIWLFRKELIGDSGTSSSEASSVAASSEEVIRDPENEYKARAYIDLYARPGEEILLQIEKDEVVTKRDRKLYKDEYASVFIVRDGVMIKGYCKASQLYSIGQNLFAKVAPKVKGSTEDWLIDLRYYMPKLKYDMYYAGTKNVTGKAMYSKDVALLQYETMQKLVRAQALFEMDGYTIKVFDAFRPLAVAKELRSDYNQDGRFPTSYNDQVKGAAVDITLVKTISGDEIAMPSKYDEYTSKTRRSASKNWTEMEKENVEYVTGIMKTCGFNSSDSNWWHFTDKDVDKYKYWDTIVFDKLTMVADPTV